MKRRDASADPEATQELVAREQPGYYPGYRTLEQQDSWDEATRDVVTKRVASAPPIRFFGAKDAVLLRAVIDRLLAAGRSHPGKAHSDSRSDRWATL